MTLYFDAKRARVSPTRPGVFAQSESTAFQKNPGVPQNHAGLPA